MIQLGTPVVWIGPDVVELADWRAARRLCGRGLLARDSTDVNFVRAVQQ